MQFDIYKIDNELFPLVLDIQSKTLDKLASRVVVPLTKSTNIKNKLSVINVEITIDSVRYIALFDEISSYPKSSLTNKVCNIANYRDDILKAYDFIVQGY